MYICMFEILRTHLYIYTHYRYIYIHLYIYIYVYIYLYIDRFRTVCELDIDLTGMMCRMLGIIPERSYSIYFEVGELLWFSYIGFGSSNNLGCPPLICSHILIVNWCICFETFVSLFTFHTNQSWSKSICQMIWVNKLMACKCSIQIVWFNKFAKS